jgi:hypothetical protein
MKRVFFLYKITYFNLKYFFIKYNIVLKGTFSQKKRKKKLTLENENWWKCLVETIKKKVMYQNEKNQNSSIRLR